MTPLYTHYTVIASKITVVSSAVSGGDTSSYIMAITPSAGTSTLAAYADQLIETKRCAWKIVSPNTGSNNQKWISRGMSIGKFLNQKVLQEDQNAGTSGADPQEGVYWHIYVGPTDQSTDLGNVTVKVIVDYIAVWHEPKVPGQS